MSMTHRVRTTAIITRANTSLLERPDRLPRAILAALPYGRGTLSALAAACHRYPEATAVVGGEQTLSYRDLWSTSRALAGGLAAEGLDERSTIGLLCRNSPFFVQSLLAGMMLGADLVFLNTGFGEGQLADVAHDEHLDCILYDDEAGVTLSGVEGPRLVSRSQASVFTSASAPHPIGPPGKSSRLVILTSGTTGRPKGAGRSSNSGADGVAAILGRIPLRLRDTIVVPAPFFHAWGLAGLMMGLGLNATIVTDSKFDAESTLRAIRDHRASGLMAVPAMLQSICSLDPQILASIETESLRLVALSGSSLSSRLATEILDRFGPVLYNVYGSTEVATATIAGPRSLRRWPNTAGHPAPGVRVEVLDPARNRAPLGDVGGVFVGNRARFEGYTTGGDKEVVRGLVSTGDLGHFDSRGLLFLDGREDDMIVSGGENVYPAEVEDALNSHEAVLEAVVVPADDERFGQALKAVVVPRPGRDVAVDDLKQFLADRLATFKVPRVFDIVDELPRNATGKVLRSTL